MCQAIEKKFLLADRTDSFIPSLKQMVEFIDLNLPHNDKNDGIKFKIKIILTELINNALKHVKNAESTIHILINNENIDIKKTDYGNRFNINGLKVIINTPPGYKVQITSDALHSVYAMFENEFNFTFICEEKISGGVADYNDLMEHFGLLIISKSADKFTYDYNKLTGLNTFNVKILLNNMN